MWSARPSSRSSHLQATREPDPPVILLLFFLGLGLLVGGADLLVRGAARLAAAAGISPLVVGLTVVSLGTSAPELGVTVAATMRGEPDLALGNVVGSNIMNVLLILGMSALVAPLVVRRRLIQLDMPLLVLVSIAVVGFALTGVVGRLEGGLLLATAFVYTALLIQHARRTQGTRAGSRQHTEIGPRGIARDIFFTVAGVGLLVLGSRWLVESARTIAELMGVSQLAIGLTVVAIGTSLPELATSVVASLRGERDIAVGNIVGSNLYNLLLVLGTAAALSPGGIVAAPTAVAFDLPIMLAITIACVPIFHSGRIVSRWEGGVFLACFVAYTTYVLLVAAGHQALPSYRDVLLFGALPLVALAVANALVQRGRNR